MLTFTRPKSSTRRYLVSGMIFTSNPTVKNNNFRIRQRRRPD